MRIYLTLFHRLLVDAFDCHWDPTIHANYHRLAFYAQVLMYALMHCRRYNWFSVEKQVESVAKIKDFPFLHLLPGHGRPGHFENASERNQLFSDALSSEGYAPEMAGAV